MTPQTNDTKPAPLGRAAPEVSEQRPETTLNSNATAPERNHVPPARLVECRRAPRGFAAMSAERQREIASMGGRAAHRAGTAHEFTAEEARAAGRKRRKRGSYTPRGEETPAEAARDGAHDSSEGLPDSVA